MKHSILLSAAFLSLTVFGASWPSEVVRFLPERDWKTGDEVTIRLTPPDIPESLALSFYTVCRDKSLGVLGRRQVFEFEGMPTKLLRPSKGENVWTATFKVPSEEVARTIKARDLTIDIRRYGADTHFDGVETFACPHRVRIAAGRQEPKTAFRLYDFGSDDSAVARGALLVSKSTTPEGLKWLSRPKRWERGKILQLDALVHDWAAIGAGKRMILQLTLPNGRWRVAAGLGAIGQMCWETKPYLPVDARLDINGKTVFTRADTEDERFRYLSHEAEPDEDIYDTYIKPVIADTLTTTEVTDGTLTLSLGTDNPEKRAAITYLAVWPEGDAEAEARYTALLVQRKANFNETIRSVPPTDLYGISAPDQHAAHGLAARKEAPVFAALQNPFDWVLPTGEAPATERMMRVAAARGEKACGGVLFRGDSDAENVIVRAEGFPEEFRATPLKIMTFRHCYGVQRMNWLAPNHLLAGPREVRRGLNYGWIIRFEIPAQARAGDYRGEISLSTPTKTYRVPATLRVYPFELPALDDYRIGVMGSGEGTDDYFRFTREELGNTSVHLFNTRNKDSRFKRDAEGRVIGVDLIGGLTVEEIDRRFKGYRAAGYTFPAPYCGPRPQPRPNAPFLDIDGLKAWTPEWKTAIRLQYETIYAIARSNGCESVTIDLGGEYGSDRRKPDEKDLADIAAYAKFVKEVCPGILLTFRCNCLGSTKALFDVMDVVGVRGRTSWEYADQIGDFGRVKPVFVYSVGGRFQNGLGGWYHGATGCFREWIAYSHHLEFNDFICEGICGCAMHFEAMPAPKADGSYTITQRGEAFRTGIDDRKYLRLLEERIAAAKADPTRAESVRNAAAFLAFVRAAAGNVQRFYDVAPYGGPFRQDGGNDWPYLRLDYVREICARQIRALETGIAADLPRFARPACGTHALILDDGPLNRAFGGTLGGAFQVPRDFKGIAKVRLDGAHESRILETMPEPVRTRQHYWFKNEVTRVFALDSAALGAGNYRLTLLLNGQEAESTLFTLFDL